jgi:hypothetical protein
VEETEKIEHALLVFQSEGKEAEEEGTELLLKMLNLTTLL